MSDFGDFLQRSRLAKIDPNTGRSYTQDALGEAVGLSGGTISAYETGAIAMPEIEKVNQIAHVLGLSVAQMCRSLGFAVETGGLTEAEERVIEVLRREPADRREILQDMLLGAATGGRAIAAAKAARGRPRER